MLEDKIQGVLQGIDVNIDLENISPTIFQMKGRSP